MDLRELLEQRLTVPTHSHDAGEIDFSDLRPTTLRIPNRDTDPLGVEGLVYYNTATKQLLAYVDGAWSHVVDASILDAKGDLLVATGADAIARLPVGADGTFLTADASQPGGMKWDTPPPGGPQGKMLWTPGPHPYRAGVWYPAWDTRDAATTANVPTGAVYFVGPFYVSQALNVDRIGMYGASGSNGRAALYSADSLGKPGTLVVESASTAIANGVTQFTITSTQLAADTFYYLAAQFDANTSTAYSYQQALVPHIGFLSAFLAASTAELYVHTQAYGAFPATPTLAVSNFNTARPILFVRTV